MSVESSNLSLRRQAPWVVIWRIVSILVTLAANVLSARLLGPAPFGVFLFVTTVMSFGSVLAMGGMNEAGLRFISESLGLGQPQLARAYLRRLVVLTLRISLAVSLLVAIGLTIFQLASGKLPNAPLLIVIAASGVLALAWQQISAEALRGYGDLRLASLFSGGQSGGPLSNLLYLAALCALAILTPSISTDSALTVMVSSVWITTPLALLGLWWVVGRSAPATEEPVRHSLTDQQCNLLLTVGGSLLTIQLLTFATYQLDIWIGGLLLKPDQLGLYGAAKRCQLLGQIPVQIATMAVISIVPRMRVQNRLGDLEQVIRRAATLAAIPSVGALSLLALFPSFVLGTVFGKAYLGAASVLLPLVLGQLAHVLFGNPAYVLTMTGRHGLVLRVNIVTTFIMVLVGGVGAKYWGPAGLAVGSAMSLTIQNGALWWLTRARLGVRADVYWRFWILLKKPAATETAPSAVAQTI
jgi:O-antigen/teichoic acid export membrane protein